MSNKEDIELIEEDNPKPKKKIGKRRGLFYFSLYIATLVALGGYIKNTPEKKKEVIVDKQILLPNKEVIVLVEGDSIRITEKEEV